MRRLFGFAVSMLVLSCGSGGSGGGKDASYADHKVQADQGLPVDGGTDVPVVSGKCFECIKPGLALRFSTMVVTEPSNPAGLPEYLNGIWGPDIEDYRLNVLLVVEKVQQNEDGSLEVTLRAGSVWHDLSAEDVTEEKHGKTPGKFYFLDEEQTGLFQAVVHKDCTFETVGNPPLLLFHPGPLDHAFICSAGDEDLGMPKDTIPIASLKASGTFTDSCMVVDGEMRGCISSQAACQICSFVLAPDYGDWKIEPDESVTPEPCKASYCQRWCGDGLWTNFGGFVEGIGVPKTCAVQGQNDGYELAGKWTGVPVQFEESK